jgi:hypothetical protein
VKKSRQNARVNEAKASDRGVLAGRIFGFKSGWFPVAYCLASLVLTIVATPFIEELRSGTLIEAILLTIVLLSAVFAVGGRGKKLALALLLAAPAFFCQMGKLFPCGRPRLYKFPVEPGCCSSVLSSCNFFFSLSVHRELIPRYCAQALPFT